MQAEALARDLGVGRTTLWRWTRAGLIPQPERRGRTSIYSPTAVAIARSIAVAAQ